MFDQRIGRRAVIWAGVGLVVAILLVGGFASSTGRSSGLAPASTPPLNVAILVSPSNPQQGDPVTFTASVTGGVAPYTYTWSNVPPGCSPQPSASWSCTIESSGNFAISLTVTDHNGTQASQTQSFSVASNGGNSGNGNGNHNGSSNSNSSGSGLNLSSFGNLLVYGLIAGIIGFGLLVALTVGVIMIAITLSRRLPRQPKGKLVCAACQGSAPAGSKFCPTCAAPLTPPKQG